MLIVYCPGFANVMLKYWQAGAFIFEIQLQFFVIMEIVEPEVWIMGIKRKVK